jgi:SAM-dependent methyltransferase
MTTLELGYGRRSLAKQVVESSGGSWTGLEPGAELTQTARIGAGGYGHAGSIPFENETFDLVFGIQSLEHWEEAHPNIRVKSTYESSLEEVWRVVKPGGRIYFDAPIHLHGHEMFIAGDVPRVLGLFDADLWTNVVAEKWRYDYDPLPRYPTPDKELAHWPRQLTGLDNSVWLLTLTAEKKI